MLEPIPWTVVLVVAIVLAVALIAIWLVLRWRRRREVEPRPASQPSLAGQLDAAWTRFYRELPARARHFPTVIVMGDAGSGKSHLIDTRVDWRGQANQFLPSSVDNPHLQLYLGPDVVVHEVSSPLLRDVGRATRRALSRLWRRVGPSATVIVVVDARTLGTTPPETLRELAQLVRGKLGALPARCREGGDVRVCLSHMDQIDGYSELVAVIGAHHGALAIAPLTERLVDATAALAAARQVTARYDANLAYGLTHRTSDEFTRLVAFFAAFPVLLSQLAPMLRGLTGEDPDQPRYRPSGLYLGSNVPANHVGDPFASDRSVVASSILRQRRFHRRSSLAVAAAGVLSVGALMWWHQTRVEAAEQAVADYIAQTTAAPGTSASQVRKVVAPLRRMRKSEALWLRSSFLDRKWELAERFASELRDRYLLPRLRVQRTNRSTMLYVVALLYASERNGLRSLIRAHVDMWATKLDLPPAVITAYLDVSRDQYPLAEEFDPEYVGSDWQAYVFDRIKPLYEQQTPITQAQLDELDTDPPHFRDEREYRIRERVIELLSSELTLATHPSIIKLLDSPLGTSRWVESHLPALHGITAAAAHRQLAIATPRTLTQLGADVERMLDVPASGEEIYRFSRDRGGDSEAFDFDVATWNHKLALASVASTVAAVREHNRAHPEQPLGFFPPDAELAEIGHSDGALGPASGLPGRYTAAAFAQHVKPALDFITERANQLALPPDQKDVLAQLYSDQIELYADSYAGALRSYYDSFRFDPGSEQALPFILGGLAQPSSWFMRFLSTVTVNATPELGDGPYYAVMADSLAGLRPLAELLAPAKGAIPGLAPYQKIISDLASSLEPAAGVGTDAGAEPPSLAGSLSRPGLLALNKLTGHDEDALARVSGWLTSANIERDLHAPFLAPVETVYALGTSELERAIADAWRHELSPAIEPLLARFPFRPDARADVAIAELESVVRAQGEEPGTFWTGFQRWLGPVTVQRDSDYRWIRGVRGPAGALATINGLARLSRALWDTDGNPTALPIEITPHPLDPTPVAGRVATMAHLRSGSSAVYAFNQRPGASTLALRWWEQGASSISLELRRPGTTRAAVFSLDEVDSPFSFFRLLCRARTPSANRARAAGHACRPRRGPHVWDIPLDASSTRSVTLTLETNPWALFQIGR